MPTLVQTGLQEAVRPAWQRDGAECGGMSGLQEPKEGSPLFIEEHAGEANASVMVEVGSSLSKAEWDEIDDKDIISKTRHGTGFRIMQVRHASILKLLNWIA